MKIWVDDVRPAPEGYYWCKSVNETKEVIKRYMQWNMRIELLDMDHDAGDFASDGGDYIEILNWLEEYMICYFPIRIHSMNPVGVENIRRIIQRNGWNEV
jgi:hypothetical protein